MSDSVASLASSLESCKHRPPYPQVFRRTFSCGHPEEFIEAWRGDDGQIVHNLITLEAFQAYFQAYSGRPEFEQARCLNCARNAKENDKDQGAWRKRCLGTYQACEMSTATKKLGATPLGGFDGILEKYKHHGSQSTYLAYHPRVSEEEHQAYYHEAQAKARSNKWAAIPAKRIWHAPVQNAGKVPLEIHQRFMSYLFEKEDKQFHQSIIDAALRNSYYSGSGCIPGDAFLNEQRDGRLSKDSLKSQQNNYWDTDNPVFPKTNTGRAENFDRPLLARISDCGFESPQMVVNHVDSTKESSQVEKSEQFILSDLAMKDSGNYLLTRSTSALLLGGQAVRPHLANPTSSKGEYTFVEDLIDRHASPYDDSPNLPRVDLKYEHPRAVPSPPKKKPLDFMLRGGSALTRASSKSEPISRNFRKLRLDLQHSTRPVNKTEPDSESPDWACRISLSIEAGRMTMDEVSMRSRDPETSKHIAQRMHSPINIEPTGRKLAQSVGAEAWRNSYSSLRSISSKCSLASWIA